MDRRAFFRNSIERLGRGVTKEASRRAEKRASNWIRPPYAADELEFLLACTRCGACIEACPHQVVFRLPARCGATAVGTPALDLLNRACRLCESWPCVAACETGALKLPEMEEGEARPLPRLGQVRLEESRCLPYQGPECGACAGSCPVPGALVWDLSRPRIVASECVGCALCRDACVVQPKAIEIHARKKEKSAS